MELETIVAGLEANGVEFVLAGEEIRLRTPMDQVPPAETVAELREHKEELLAYLRERQERAQASIPVCLGDPYEARLRAVLLQTCRPEYPAGMVPWLETANPSLYDDLTRRLPDLIHKLWTAHAPLEEFQHVVDAWLGTHRRACELYKVYMAEPTG